MTLTRTYIYIYIYTYIHIYIYTYTHIFNFFCRCCFNVKAERSQKRNRFRRRRHLQSCTRLLFLSRFVFVKAREHETDIHLYNLQPFKSVSDRNENNGDGDSIAFIHNVCIYICIEFFLTKKTETSIVCVYIYIQVTDACVYTHVCIYIYI